MGGCAVRARPARAAAAAAPRRGAVAVQASKVKKARRGGRAAGWSWPGGAEGPGSVGRQRQAGKGLGWGAP